MRKLSRLLAAAAVLLAVSSCTAQSTSNVQAVKPSLLIELSAPKDGIKTGLPVRLEVMLTNTTREYILLTGERGPNGVEYRGLEIDVRDASGKILPKAEAKPQRIEELPLNPFFAVPLEPGKSLKYEIDLTRKYDLRRPGKYNVQVSRYDSAARTTVRSNTTPLTMTE